MVRPGNAVEAHSIHLRQSRRPADKGSPGKAPAGEAVRPHGEGDDEEGLRAAGFQKRGQLWYALIRGQGLHQKAGDPPLQKQRRLAAVYLRWG